jgi:hypothetical protein
VLFGFVYATALLSTLFLVPAIPSLGINCGTDASSGSSICTTIGCVFYDLSLQIAAGSNVNQLVSISGNGRSRDYPCLVASVYQ